MPAFSNTGRDAAAPRSTPPSTATGLLPTSSLAHAADDSGVPVVLQTSRRRGRPFTPPRSSFTWATAAWAASRASGNDPMGASSWLIMPRTRALSPLPPPPSPPPPQEAPRSASRVRATRRFIPLILPRPWPIRRPHRVGGGTVRPIDRTIVFLLLGLGA